MGPGTGTGAGSRSAEGTATELVDVGVVVEVALGEVVDFGAVVVVGASEVGSLAREGAPSLSISLRSRVGNGFWTCHVEPFRCPTL